MTHHPISSPSLRGAQAAHRALLRARTLALGGAADTTVLAQISLGRFSLCREGGVASARAVVVTAPLESVDQHHPVAIDRVDDLHVGGQTFSVSSWHDDQDYYRGP